MIQGLSSFTFGASILKGQFSILLVVVSANNGESLIGELLRLLPPELRTWVGPALFFIIIIIGILFGWKLLKWAYLAGWEVKAIKDACDKISHIEERLNEMYLLLCGSNHLGDKSRSDNKRNTSQKEQCENVHKETNPEE